MSLNTDHQLPRKRSRQFRQGVYSNRSARDTALLPQPVPHQRSESGGSFSSKTNNHATSSDKDSPDLSSNEDSSGFQEGSLGSDGGEVE
jgi:hypothetical protein